MYISTRWKRLAVHQIQKTWLVECPRNCEVNNANVKRIFNQLPSPSKNIPKISLHLPKTPERNNMEKPHKKSWFILWAKYKQNTNKIQTKASFSLPFPSFHLWCFSMEFISSWPKAGAADLWYPWCLLLGQTFFATQRKNMRKSRTNIAQHHKKILGQEKRFKTSMLLPGQPSWRTGRDFLA